MNLNNIDLSYLNNIQPSEYSNFKVSSLITKLLEILPEEKVSAENKPETYNQIIELFKVIEEIVKMYKGEISAEFIDKVSELKAIANLREFNPDLHITLGFALTEARDLAVGEFDLQMIENYSRDELASHYRNLSRPYENALKGTPNNNTAMALIKFHPNPKLLKTIDERLKYIDTISAMDKRINFLEELIAANNIKRIRTEIYPLRNYMRILGNNLPDEFRARITQLVERLPLDIDSTVKIDMENALKGNFDSSLPGDFIADEA